jgi:mannitol/fructose-specific phosphotransferase system IIA component (Ntr-type)
MNLLKFIEPGCIATGLEAPDIGTLLHRQAEMIHHHIPERYREDHTLDSMVEMLSERENKQSTGLGNGILVPHARVPAFNHLGIFIAVLKEPMDYDTIDGQPIRLSCMVIAPAETPNIVIKIWSTLARLLNDPAVHQYFLQAADPQTIYDYLKTADLDLDLCITASDLMVKPRAKLRETTSIQDVTHLMYIHKEPCLGVVDEQNRIIGQVTTDDVFQYGMPEFFTQLQSVSFVRQFNPLGKYFQHESEMTAGDIMKTDVATVPPTATLIEIIFQLSVKRRLKVFVTSKDGKLLGVIDRLAILDRAINF